MSSVEISHEITFVDKNGIIIEVQKVKQGEFINPKTFKKKTVFNGQTYKLSGWEGKVANSATQINVLQKPVLSTVKKARIFFLSAIIFLLSTFSILGSIANKNRDIMYNTNGGTLSSNVIKSFNYWDSISLPTPTHNELSFYGWYESPTFSGEPIKEIRNRASNLVVYARWYMPYTITFDSNGGNNVSSIKQQTMNGSIQMPNNPSRNGYTFNGWYKTEIDDNGNGSKVTWPFIPENNTSLYAGWTGNSYTVTLSETVTTTSYVVSFNINGGSGSVSSQTITTSNGLTYPTIPTKSGYVFAGWYDNSSTTGSPYNFSSVVNSNKTLYAKWISYSGAQGVMNIGTKYTSEVSISSTIKYWAFVPLTSQTVSLGGYFRGDNMVYHGIYNSSKTLLNSNNGNYVLTAGTLYFYGLSTSTGTSTSTERTIVGTTVPSAGGKVSGTSSQTKILIYGSSFTLTVPTRSGYTFLGWYDGFGGTGKKYTDSNGRSVINWDKTSNVTLYPKWG